MATVVSDPSYPLRVTRPAPSAAEVMAPAAFRPAQPAARHRRRARPSERESFFAAIVGGLTGGFTAYDGRRR
jgi:hypothetical protein